MAYVNYEYYSELYGDNAVSESDFNRLLWECEKRVNNLTTGVDGVRKLKIAFPTDEDDAEAVMRCICKLVEIAAKIEAAEAALSEATGYITDESTGTVRGKVITSKSSGSESISYSAGSTTSGSTATLIDKALADKDIQDRLYRDTITEYLSGVSDANGINLLFAGAYPARFFTGGITCRII